MKKINYFDVKKDNKIFRKGDIIVYAVAVIVIAILLCDFLIPRTDYPSLQKIEIFYKESRVFSYQFSNESVIIKGIDGVNITTEESQDGLRVRIVTEKGSNVLLISDDSAVKVEADCSVYADCVNNFDSISKGGDFIICLPHELKVIGVGKVDDNKVQL